MSIEGTDKLVARWPRWFQEFGITPDIFLSITHMEYKRWGPRKIAQGLREIGFAGYEAEKALNQVDEHRFREILAALVERRKPELAEKRERVIRYLLGRGFLVNEVLRAIEEAEER